MLGSWRTICVVGGGPAGLAAAIALKREHSEVIIIDCATPPIDKACGEGLLPPAITALEALGVRIPVGAGFPFRGIRFSDGTSAVTGDFPNGAAIGMRRPVLHELLVRRATELGVAMVWNAKHVQLVNGGVSVDGRVMNDALVIAADGQNSALRRQAGLDRARYAQRRYGFRRHYRMPPWSAYMELHWGKQSQVYVTPVAADEVCVASISRDPQLRLEEAISEVPELEERLRDAIAVMPMRGGLSVSRRLRSVARRNVVLAGDASGSVDAITGEGLGLAFQEALALARTVSLGQLDQYEQAHITLMKRPRTMGALLLALERHPWFRWRALAGLARHPEVFDAFLAIHVGASSFRDLCSWRFLDFARAFLTA